MKTPRVTLNPKEAFLCSLTIVAGVFAFHLYWFSPQKSQLAELRGKVAESRARAEASELLLAKNITRKPASADSSGFELNRYTKGDTRFSSVLSSLAQTEPGSSASITRISAEKQTTLAGWTRVPLEVQLDAAFLSVGRFLERLENSDHLIEIESVEVHRDPDELKKCSSKIKLSSYVAVTP